MDDSDLAMQAKGVRDPATSLLANEIQFADLAKLHIALGCVFATLTDITVASERSNVWKNRQGKSKEPLARVFMAVRLVASTMLPATATATLKVGAVTKSRGNNKHRQVLGAQRRLGWIRRWPSIQDLFHRTHARFHRSPAC